MGGETGRDVARRHPRIDSQHVLHAIAPVRHAQIRNCYGFAAVLALLALSAKRRFRPVDNVDSVLFRHAGLARRSIIVPRLPPSRTPK